MIHRRLSYRAVGHVHRDLPTLMLVAQVRGASYLTDIPRDSFTVQPVPRLRFQTRIHRRYLLNRRSLSRVYECLNVVVSQVGEQQSVGGQHSRSRGHDHRLHPQQRRQSAGVHRPRAAKGQQREVLGVQSPADGHGAHCPCHVVVGDFDDPRCSLGQFKAKRSRYLVLNRLSSCVDVQRHLAAQQVWRQVAEDEPSVSDRRYGPALVVTDRARVGACAFWTDG